VAETAPPKYRPVALGLYYACWGVGTLIASGVCYSVRELDPNSMSQLIPLDSTLLDDLGVENA
jgi:hypothetical protein